MSGGIDSSYSAYLLLMWGFRVVGFTFNLLPASFQNKCGTGMCCSAAATGRARRIADRLSIPHYVIDMRDEFEEYVISRFIEEYRLGRTPNPCILCNRYIKFGSFLTRAVAMGADLVATGHYATVAESDSGWQLKKGKDRTKDQSYFLYPIRSCDLRHVLFPLADCTKTQVKKAFQQLDITEKKIEESQDICFVPGNDYKTFIEQFIPSRPGPVVTTEEKRIGTHQVIHSFTVGQRRGINIPYGEALYVVEIRATDNTVVVGTKDRLRQSTLVANDVNSLSGAVEGRARAKVRYRQKEEPCSYSLHDGLLYVAFDNPTTSITPGQSVVLYDGDTVLGGGTIVKAGAGG
jgi:tRNA-specific 2-thiouridylase